MPVRILSRVFRRLYLDGLRQAFAAKRLAFPGPLQAHAAPAAFARWLATLQAQDWVVYAKRPFGGPEQVLKYLARYTHRVAISNSRIVHVDDVGVTFRYKEYADDHRDKVMTLTAEEFLRRFVQHVLPAGFVKVRHYGLLAPRHRDRRLAACRRLLAVEAVRTRLPGTATAEAVPPPAAPSCTVAAVIEPCCPHCGSRRLARRELPPTAAAANIPPPDTS